jgi:hypothetical protein
MKTLFLCVALVASNALASTIVNVSTVVGQTYTVAVTASDTTGSNMVGMLLTATYSNGTSLTCTWTAAGTCANTPNGGGFTVSYPANTSTSPLNGGTDWTITNTRTGLNMTSISFNGLTGLTAFDRCIGITGSFNDTGTNLLSCLGEGTTNSSLGYSVGDGNGGSAINANVVYTNELHVAGQAPVGDLWGKITIAFTSNFTATSTFTFRTDTDTLSNIIITDTPEPGTFAMMGAALLFVRWKLKAHSIRTPRN